MKPNDTSTQEAHKLKNGQAARTDFKAQALNRRAKVFGEAMQLTIINEPMPDKQTMFECAEVLNEVVKAVENKKKALRLDYTPYRLYEMYKKKLPKSNDYISEDSMDISDDEKTKAKKKEAVRHFMQQENHRR